MPSTFMPSTRKPLPGTPTLGSRMPSMRIYTLITLCLDNIMPDSRIPG